MKLIGLCGYKRSGKDTVAQMLRIRGYKQMAFATPLKLMLSELMKYAGTNDLTISNCLDGDMKDYKLAMMQDRSARQLMQTLGTEWGRNLIGQNLWVDILFSRAQIYNKVVVSDVRFDNEVVALRKHGGKLILIDRGLTPDGHASENIKHFAPDFTIGNYGTLSILETTVKEVEEILWTQSS